MKTFCILTILVSVALACNRKGSGEVIQYIVNAEEQQSLFNSLVVVIGSRTVDTTLVDSTAFLLLPIQSICPSCRKKIIDSIVANQNRLSNRQFIIISANGGRKTIEAYFRELGYLLPVIPGHLFLDSTNKALKHKLYVDKPGIFYSDKKKVYAKVYSVPATVRHDLNNFFSGIIDSK